jgi:hypothetical protein
LLEKGRISCVLRSEREGRPDAVTPRANRGSNRRVRWLLSL